MKTQTNFKITLTTILFTVASISGYMIGQTSSITEDNRDNKQATYYKYVSPENTWTTVGYSWIDNSYGSHRFRFSADSVFFEGQWYFQFQGTGSEHGDNWGNIGLFREENGVVYGITRSEERIFMDFNLEIGDRITIPYLDFVDSFEYIVVGIDTIELLDGSLRKRLLLDCYQWQDEGFEVYFVEGLGSMGAYIGHIGCFLDVHEALLCFYNNDEMLYTNPNFNGCWITSVTDIHSQGINIYPNPTTDFLIIEFDDALATEITFKVYDYTGKLIRNFNNAGYQSHYRLQVSELTAGFYYLTWEMNGEPFVYHFVVGE